MKDYFLDLPQKYNENLPQEVDSNKPDDAPQPSVPVPTSPEAAALMGILDITKETIRCFTEYAKCKEHEKTERKRITATLRVMEYQISAQKEAYLKNLDKQYEERNRLYDMAEKTQEKALELGDKEMLKICYNLILNVYNKPIDFNGTTPALNSNLFESIDSFNKY